MLGSLSNTAPPEQIVTLATLFGAAVGGLALGLRQAWKRKSSARDEAEMSDERKAIVRLLNDRIDVQAKTIEGLLKELDQIKRELVDVRAENAALRVRLKEVTNQL